MKRLLIGASTLALTFGVIAVVSPSALAQEGEQITATHSDLASNRDALKFLRFVTAIPTGDASPVMGAYSPEDRTVIANFVRDTVLQGAQGRAEKAERIHHWIATQIRYARADETPAVTPREVLDNRVARGQGFSNLYKAMLDSVGIPNVLVTGLSQEGEHQWNIVSLDGDLFHSDPAEGVDSFKKDIEDFSVDHATLRLHGVEMVDGPYHYEYHRGVSLTGISDPERAKVFDIPATAQGMPVVRLSNEALASEGVSALSIPTHITDIDVQAGTRNVTCFAVVQPHPQFSADSCALFSADNTQLIAYPSKATARSFLLPTQTTAINHKRAFDSPALETLDVGPQNPRYAAYAGALYSKDYSSLRVIPGGMKKIVVNGKTVLEAEAFAHRNSVESIVFENGVTAIPARTFTALPALRSVEFPASVNVIDPEAFVDISPTAVTLVGEKGSVVESFARMNSFLFRAQGDKGQATPQPPARPDTPQQTENPVQSSATGQPGTPAQPGTPDPPTPPATGPAVPPADAHASDGGDPGDGSETQDPSADTTLTPLPQGESTSSSESTGAGAEEDTQQVPAEEQVASDAEKALDEDAKVKAGATADKHDTEKDINAAGLEKIGLTTDVTLSPGATMTIVASGYASNEVVTFAINEGSKTMGLVRADSLGIATVTWMIPADFTPGDHTVIAVGTTGKTLKMPVTVAPFPDLKKSPVSAVKPRPSEIRSVDLLAQTGTHIVRAFAVVTFLIGTGATVLALRRRMDEPTP